MVSGSLDADAVSALPADEEALGGFSDRESSKKLLVEVRRPSAIFAPAFRPACVGRRLRLSSLVRGLGPPKEKSSPPRCGGWPRRYVLLKKVSAVSFRLLMCGFRGAEEEVIGFCASFGGAPGCPLRRTSKFRACDRSWISLWRSKGIPRHIDDPGAPGGNS